MREIQLNHGLVAKVDDEDFTELNQFRWHRAIRKNVVYAARSTSRKIGRTEVLMHRQIMGLTGSRYPEVDHWDRDGLNNQKHNLRIASQSQNNYNQCIQEHSSNYKGVHWNKLGQNWQAYITLPTRHLYLGSFFTEKLAGLAYDRAARQHFGEFARPNFPEIIDYSMLPHPQQGRGRRTSTSKYRGVSWSNVYRKWVVAIRWEGKSKTIGRYNDEIEAALAYDRKSLELLGPAAFLNFPKAA